MVVDCVGDKVKIVKMLHSLNERENTKLSSKENHSRKKSINKGVEKKRKKIGKKSTNLVLVQIPNQEKHQKMTRMRLAYLLIQPISNLLGHLLA